MSFRFSALAAALACGILISACGGSGKSAASSTSPPRSTSATTTSASSLTTVISTSTAPGLVVSSSADITATMHPSTHHPRVNAPWPIHFTVTRAGRPLRAKVRYEFMLAGNVVARRSNYTFNGHFSDLFRWPASAAGYPLTFRAVIIAAGHTLFLDYPVQVRH